jgi:hypothetical protein
MYIPGILQENATLIRELDIDNQETPFNREHWRKHIPDIDNIFDEIGRNVISRREISGIFPNDPNVLVPCDPTRQAELRRFFILVMIWGYGNVGTGPWRVAQMIASPGFPKILCRVGEECYYGSFLKAYGTLSANINRLGPAFASKYLYFFCQNFKAQVKPLIFDSIVVNTMNTFNWPSWCVEYIANGNNPRKQPYAYGQYLVMLHNWANVLSCRPDQIEYFMWARGMGII